MMNEWFAFDILYPNSNESQDPGRRHRSVGGGAAPAMFLTFNIMPIDVAALERISTSNGLRLPPPQIIASWHRPCKECLLTRAPLALNIFHHLLGGGDV